MQCHYSTRTTTTAIESTFFSRLFHISSFFVTVSDLNDRKFQQIYPFLSFLHIFFLEIASFFCCPGAQNNIKFIYTICAYHLFFGYVRKSFFFYSFPQLPITYANSFNAKPRRFFYIKNKSIHFNLLLSTHVVRTSFPKFEPITYSQWNCNIKGIQYIRSVPSDFCKLSIMREVRKQSVAKLTTWCI